MTSTSSPAEVSERAGFVVALLGAESTGKSTLAGELAEALRKEGLDCAVVSEYLRTFCDQQGRTPLALEQAAIAEEQTRQISAAAARHRLVVADTTALMTAVYSDLVFGDTSLYALAIAARPRADLTLLMAVDLPWQSDGLQRDGPHVRIPVDRRLRAALHGAGQDYQIVTGQGQARSDRALAAIRQTLRSQPSATRDDGLAESGGSAPHRAVSAQGWRHLCSRCGDPTCERHLFARLPHGGAG